MAFLFVLLENAEEVDDKERKRSCLDIVVLPTSTAYDSSGLATLFFSMFSQQAFGLEKLTFFWNLIRIDMEFLSTITLNYRYTSTSLLNPSI